MASVGRLVAVLGALLRAAALGVLRDTPTGEAGPKTIRRPCNRWLSTIASDVASGSTEYSADRSMAVSQGHLDGFQRARAFNHCPVKYRGPSHAPVPVVGAQSRAVYWLQTRTGTGNFTRPAWPQSGRTWARFTFVGDPVSRVVADFLDGRMKCSGGAGRDTSKMDPTDVLARIQVLEWFEEHVSNIEKGRGNCWANGPLAQRGRLPRPEGYPMDFIGDLANLKADWRELSEYMRDNVQSDMGELDESLFQQPHNKSLLLNASVLPANVTQKICAVFRDDYCCFRLPVPAACRLDCYYAQKLTGGQGDK